MEYHITTTSVGVYWFERFLGISVKLLSILQIMMILDLDLNFPISFLCVVMSLSDGKKEQLTCIETSKSLKATMMLAHFPCYLFKNTREINFKEKLLL